MNPLVLVLSLFVASCFAAPAQPAVTKGADCDNDGNIIAAAPYTSNLKLAEVPSFAGFAGLFGGAAIKAVHPGTFNAFPVQNPIQFQAPAPYVVSAPVETRIHYADTPVVSGYSAQILKPAIGTASFAAPTLPSPVVALEKTNVEYTAPVEVPVAAPQIAFAAPQPALHVVPAEKIQKTQVEYTAPAPVAIASPQFVAAPQFTIAAPVDTKIHLANTPVVTGYSAEIIKPALGAAAAFPSFGFQNLALSSAGFAAPLAAEASVKLGPIIPSGDAPAPEELVQKEKVLAPVRPVSSITPQVTVELPTKVNVQRVPVDVHVPAPYPQPVPVSVGTAVHTPLVAPALAPYTISASPALAADVPCDN